MRAPRVLLALLIGAPAIGCAPGSPPRIVLIVADTLRADHLSPYGGEHETPNLAELAERGQVFTNASASFHQTSMSMGALFTGRTPSIESGEPGRSLRWNGSTWCGMSRFAGPEVPDDVCLPPSLVTLGEHMQEAGYWTIGVVSNQFLFDPAGFGHGFDDWVEVGERGEGRAFGARGPPTGLRTWRHVDAAVAEALDRRPDDRFFLYVHYMDAHDYGSDPDDYAGGVARVDHAVGRLMRHLERRGLREDAVVVFTSDHGERLRERHAVPGRRGHLGNPSFQEVLRVPLIVAPPVVEDPGAFVRLEDVHDLLRHVAGAGTGEERDLEPGELFVGERRWRTYRHGRFKSSAPRSGEGLLLFDLLEDPGERRNVAGRHPAIAKRHRRRMDELSEALGTRPARERDLSPDDERRLRALGYLE